MKEYCMNDGRKIPAVGLGTFRVQPSDCERTVASALRDGYRLVDTANVYLNERAVGRGIAASGIAREEIVVTSKIWPTEYHKKARAAIDATLSRLGLDYLDVLLLHQPFGDVESAWAALEEAVEAGKVKTIGVSNFNEADLKRLLSHCKVKPALDQVECHPYFQQRELRAFLKQHGILLESWYPLGSGDSGLLGEPSVVRLAEKYAKTPVQIVLKWHVEEGFVVIPGTKDPAHAHENRDLFDFTLSEEEMDSLRALDRGTRFFTMKRGIQRYAVFFQRMNYDRQP